MKKDFEVIDEKFEGSQNALYSYIIGFALSLLLTIIPYSIVTERVFSQKSLLVGVVLFGIAQLIVQVIFFLHLPAKTKPFWNIIVFIFTLIIIMFLVVGTLWIMYHLNYNMMGVSPFKSNEGYIPQ